MPVTVRAASAYSVIDPRGLLTVEDPPTGRLLGDQRLKLIVIRSRDHTATNTTEPLPRQQLCGVH